MKINQVLCEDAFNELRRIENSVIDLIYMDPPFFYTRYSETDLQG